MTRLGAGPTCPECGAQLRRGRQAGQRCDPCQRKGPRLVLPEGFYDQPRLAAALVVLDFGPVFRAVRAQLGWSQQTLGEYLGIGQARVSGIEKGTRALLDVATVVRVANRLAIPAGRLGFVHGVTVGTRATTGTGGKGGWVYRRDFVQHVSALALGGAAAPELDLDRLVALYEPGPEGTRRVGEADVAALERATGEYERLRYTFGGGYARDTATAHLRATLPLLDAQVDPAVHGRLHAATAHLALLAGRMCFDLELHEAARRLWIAGLQIARGAEDPVTTDLTGHLLGFMAIQSVELGRADEAVALVRVGQAAGEGVHRVSPSTATTLLDNLARANAVRGDVRGCERALGDAEEEFTKIDLAAVAPWACVDGAVKLITWQGHARYELGRAHGDQRSLQRALPALIVADGNPRAISRALNLPQLAGAHALTGDVDTAVRVGHQAVDLVTAMHSQRARTRLRVLHTVLEPMHTSPGVAELRERLIIATAAA